MKNVQQKSAARTNVRREAATKTIPAPPDSKVTRKRSRAPVAAATSETARPLSIAAPAPPAGEHEKPTRAHADDLADMAAEVLEMIEEIDSALCQATLDVDSITLAKNIFVEESVDTRLERFSALQGKLDHELLTCFRLVSGLRALAHLYAGRAESECAA